MSAPSHFSTVPTHRELAAQRKRELQQETSIKYVASSYCNPCCPDCGLKLKTKTARSNTKDWIVQCHNYHAWRIYYIGPNLTLEQIPYTDSRYPRRNIHE